MIGSNPFETEQDRWDTLSLLLELPHPFSIHPVNPLALYPKHEITDRALELGYIQEMRTGRDCYLIEEEKIHSDTVCSLNIGIPPVATSLGFLIFLAGFQHIKDWYFSEGGFEGPRKLWGEKAQNETVVQTFYQKTMQQIHTFLKKRPSSTHQALEVAAKERAKEGLKIIERNIFGQMSLSKCTDC